IPELTDKIKQAGLSCLVLFGKPEESVLLIRQMKKNNINIPVYGSLSVMGEGLSREEERTDYQGISVVTSAGWLAQSGTGFCNAYSKAFGVPPDAVAAYAYDGMNVLVTAIRNSNFNIDNIKDTMLRVHYKGVTGTISFDERGNRQGKAKIIEFKNGIPVTVYP
ncbi:MAG TPA: ABC transporter substrate-binding protein, partial [Bacteroidales bacterium]|nr:ABC transporter substrate-binding protein [Bacteroidales bacterium]